MKIRFIIIKEKLHRDGVKSPSGRSKIFIGTEQNLYQDGAKSPSGRSEIFIGTERNFHRDGVGFPIFSNEKLIHLRNQTIVSLSPSVC